MSKLASLITLINSLSKSERKSISLEICTKKNKADYVHLYILIEKKTLPTAEEIKLEFLKTLPNSTFSTSVVHLFDTILTILVQLRTNQDSYFSLFNQLMHSKVLFEKSIYNECFQLLEKIQSKATTFENFSILLMAQKLELSFLLSLDFPEISEQNLLSKQYKINETIKKIRKINDHASLYELLKHRILHNNKKRLSKQNQGFNDLIVSEMSIVNNSNFECFEIEKNHKLFQSNFLMNVGDYKSGLNSFYELNTLFEENLHLLSNPPIYYLMTIEGILESLRTIKNYEETGHFIDQLRKIKTTSNHFKIQIDSVVFLYSLFPLLDTGKFEEAKSLIEINRDSLYDKATMLIPLRQSQLTLYNSLVFLGIGEFKKARKILNNIIQNDKNPYSMPLFKAIRLVNLILLYELKEFDYLPFEVRSMKREILKEERIYQIELLLLKIVCKPIESILKVERIKLWNKIEPQILDIKSDNFELQLLRIFDFTAWIESKVTKVSMESILRNHSKPNFTKL